MNSDSFETWKDSLIKYIEEEEKRSLHAKYAEFLVEKARSDFHADPNKSRQLLEDARDEALYSDEKNVMRLVGKAWIDLFNDKERAVESLIGQREDPDLPGYEWTTSIDNLYAILGNDSLPTIERLLPELEFKHPTFLGSWAKAWGLCGAKYREDMIRCIRKEEESVLCRHYDKYRGCLFVAGYWSEVPEPKCHKEVRKWLGLAEDLAKKIGTDAILDCAREWYNIYPKELKHEVLFKEAEPKASSSYSYMRLAEHRYIFSQTREGLLKYALKAEEFAKRKEDWKFCARAWQQFVGSEKDYDRCMNRAAIS